jgi:hypothetical protein
MKRIILFSWMLFLFVFINIQNNNGKCEGNTTGKTHGYLINYLNEKEPGDIPLVFARGTVSVEGKNTHRCTFSPDGHMLIFSRYPDRKSFIMRYENGKWSNPAEAFFQGKETSFNTEGNRLFYYSGDGDIYYIQKKVKTWGAPVNVASINTSETEYYPSITSDGTLFFSRNSNWSEGRIMYASFVNEVYTDPVDIGLPVNNGGASHAFVSPDKSYMLFNSPREGSHTKLDIWISFRNEDGSWSEPKNPGVVINSDADAILCPTVSPDGKYLFFTKLNFSSNTGNVYWVSTEFINKMKSN